ncbi:hypothetical protein PTW37_17670 (plasmid) [Arthrobacter agilis]|uniref:hypothetical protein n=1 Tax=Arthrobacter agilis TaxID=37921 RepID=UPI00236578D7|nr:hypothetical protein [Arthrobacter agilis]WDF35229.1 hypothetical protein PTW37_17670 [Arthrobacter agilis]
MTTIDLETTKNQARKLLDSRIASVTDLTLARKRVEELRDQLADAEREDKKAYVRATKDGWREDELRKLGLETGGVSQRRRRAKGEASGTTSVDAADAAPIS